ncbi:MAG TPA: ABC transporter permease subunit [Actinomycetota bacterium]|nr:ABC transporter permease subunit [Actinomycetota bacterium]
MSVILRKELRDQRRALLGWGGGLAAMVLMYSSFWPSIRDNADQFESYLENLPEAFRNLVGELSLTTPVGYLQSELFSFLGPALLLVFAIGAGARSLAGEEEQRTMDVLAVTPLTRRRIVVEKFAAMSVTGLGLGVLVWLAVIAIGPVFDLRIPAGDLAAATLQLVLLGIAFGSIAMFLGSWRGRRGLAIGVTAAIAVAAFLIDAFAPAVDGLEWAARLSPFYYYGHSLPLANGLEPGHTAVLVLIAGTGLLGAVLTFDRRDVGT